MAQPTTKAHSQTKNHSPKNHPQSLPFHNVSRKHSKRQPETYAIERQEGKRKHFLHLPPLLFRKQWTPPPSS
jgi:hypothetical protein